MEFISHATKILTTKMLSNHIRKGATKALTCSNSSPSLKGSISYFSNAGLNQQTLLSSFTPLKARCKNNINTDGSSVSNYNYHQVYTFSNRYFSTCNVPPGGNNVGKIKPLSHEETKQQRHAFSSLSPELAALIKADFEVRDELLT